MGLTGTNNGDLIDTNVPYGEWIGVDIDNFSFEEELKKLDNLLEDYSWKVTLRLYVPPSKTKGGIILPEQAQDEARYSVAVGLVVSIGKGAYAPAKFPAGPWCKLGQWHQFPRNAGVITTCNKIPIIEINDNAVGRQVRDPRLICR